MVAPLQSPTGSSFEPASWRRAGDVITALVAEMRAQKAALHREQAASVGAHTLGIISQERLSKEEIEKLVCGANQLRDIHPERPTVERAFGGRPVFV